eukprot:scaffold6631_cov90-Isochrysis_galbana.AAC.1
MCAAPAVILRQSPAAAPPPPGKKPPNRTPPGPGDKWEKGQELRKGGKASAPKNFGVMSGRRTLAPGEDLPGGTRVDPEGMVYALEDTGGGPDAVAGVYFCDRFRRYRFDTRASGLALLRGLVRAPALKAGPCLALFTARALTLFTPLLWTTIHRPPNLCYSRRPLALFIGSLRTALLTGRPVVRLGEMLCLNAERFSPDPAEAEAERAEGYALYEEKPTLRKGNIKRVAADGETHTVFPHVPIRVSISGRVGCTWGSPRVDFRFGFGRPCLFRVWISCQSDGSGLFRSRSVFRWARRELGSDLFLIRCLLPDAPGRGQLPAWVFFSSPLSISGCAGGHVVRRGVWNGRVGTWSDEEYGMVGFQWMYLRFKSFQRFTETCAGAPSEEKTNRCPVSLFPYLELLGPLPPIPPQTPSLTADGESRCTRLAVRDAACCLSSSRTLRPYTHKEPRAWPTHPPLFHGLFTAADTPPTKACSQLPTPLPPRPVHSCRHPSLQGMFTAADPRPLTACSQLLTPLPSRPVHSWALLERCAVAGLLGPLPGVVGGVMGPPDGIEASPATAAGAAAASLATKAEEAHAVA